LTIADLASATGSTPLHMSRVGARLCKAGLLIRHRVGQITHYSLATTAAL
jgi:hypothetical protein